MKFFAFALTIALASTDALLTNPVGNTNTKVPNVSSLIIIDYADAVSSFSSSPKGHHDVVCW